MAVIKIRDLCSEAMTEEQGRHVREAVRPVLEAGGSVTLDFDGIRFFTCSFFNALTGHYILKHGFDYVFEHVGMANLSSVGLDTFMVSSENAKLVAARDT